jgi:Tfp pilus assembly protein PilN
MMRLAAVEIVPGEVRIARAERRLGVLRLLEVARIPAADDAARGAALAALARWHPHVVSTALPAAQVTHRFLTLPFRDRRRLGRTVPQELLAHLPVDPESASVAWERLGPTTDGTAVLAVVARRHALEALAAPLTAAGLAPTRIDVAPLPAWNLVLALADGALLVADGPRSALSVARGGRLAGLRALGAGTGDPVALAAEIRWSVAALGAEALPMVVAGPDADVALVEALRAGGIAASALAGEGAHCPVATGLVMAAGRRAPAGVTLAAAPDTAPAARRRLAALVATAAVLALVDLTLFRTGLARRAAALTAAVRAEAEAALPGVRLVSPRAQLEAASAAAARRAGGAGATPVLDVLRELSTRAPAGRRIDIDELTVDADRVTLHGRADAFDAVDALRRALAGSPLLAEVTAEETRATVDGRRVEFRLRATRRPAGTSS